MAQGFVWTKVSVRYSWLVMTDAFQGSTGQMIVLLCELLGDKQRPLRSAEERSEIVKSLYSLNLVLFTLLKHCIHKTDV